MYFAHLLRLCMPENLKKWYRSYVDHSWDRNVLRNEHLLKVRKVEKKLERLGEDATKSLGWTELKSLVKNMGYKATTKDDKMMLFCTLKEHMIKSLLWKTSNGLKSTKRKIGRSRKRTAEEVEVESSEKSNSLRRSNRLRRSTKCKEFSNSRLGDHIERPKKKPRTKKYGESKANTFSVL